MLAEKLKSRRGISILMGLLLLLVCMTAGAAALTAAASNAGRYTHLRQDQQRYLAVSSAVRLMREELCTGAYSAQATLTETEVSRAVRKDGKVVGWRRETSYALATSAPDAAQYSGSFGPWLEGQLDEAFQTDAVPSDWWITGGVSVPAAPSWPLECDDLSVSVSSSAGVDALLSQVKWELTMDSDYNLTANFWLEETDKSGKVSRYYETVLTIPAAAETDESTSTVSEGRTTTTTTTRTFTVTWPEAGAVIRQS